MNILKSTLLVGLTSVLCGNAYSQSKMNAWEGAYGQAGVGYETFMPAKAIGSTNIGISLPNSTTAKNAQGPAGNFSGGYNFGINNSFVMGIGATVYPGDSASATTSSTTAGVSGVASGVYNVANIWVAYLSPGYVIDKDRLAYLKLGYSGATIHTSSAGYFPQQNTHVSGLATGVGYKEMFSDSLYGFGEVNYAAYSPKSVSVLTDGGATINTTSKGSGVDFIVGIGYRF